MKEPAPETSERWAWDYIGSTDLRYKLAPPDPPKVWDAAASPRRLAAPGRPAELQVVDRAPKTPKRGALRNAKARAHVLHTFFHHELQAAELMAWAVLAFPDTPESFRRGLIAVARDEVRHMNLYRGHIETLGFSVGDFPVRDWFWERVPSCPTATHFVAVMGMGFEAANLEHAPVFAARFREVGDEVGAEIQERVAREELAHVRFAIKWFRTWTGGLDFANWARHLPEPLSPMLMKGKSVDRAARSRAGMDAAFIEELEAWSAHAPGF